MAAPSGPPQVIAMLAYPKMTALDLVGPQMMLASLMNVEIHLVWKDRAPVPCDTGFSIVPTTTFADCPANVEVLFVPGGTQGTLAVMEDPEVLAFLVDRAARARWVTSVCTGALVLGAAGLLRGYRATTHWIAREVLRGAGAIPVDQRVVLDRSRVTGAGVSAGLDLGLQLAIELRGEGYARAVALNAEYAPAPPVVAGTPATAGPQATSMLRELYAPFVAAATAATQRASATW
ncbi:MAG: DJ-1/PfpI family protein [Myxococcales bacterium]|nr:DJ-1/PfpI family protein [Myxococcales bacterium]